MEKYHKVGVESDGEATSFFHPWTLFIRVDKIPVPGTPKSLEFELVVGVQGWAGLQAEGQGSLSGDRLEIHDRQVAVTQPVPSPEKDPMGEVSGGGHTSVKDF